MFDIIAFDADDTLWHNEPLFHATQERYRQLLAKYHSPEWIDERLYATEMRNLEHFGYGIKSFALSMIETAIELTEGRISSGEIQQIIEYAKTMLCAEVNLLDHVSEVIPQLANSHKLMIITKGDLFNQEAKIERSNLARYFEHIEVVSEKSADVYQSILGKYSIDPQRFLMIGNSLKSDILPVLELGAQAVHIPYHITWAHEQVDQSDLISKNYHECEHLGHLPNFLAQLHSP
jgi:putative hydrolase of the HAD superfamily